MFLLVFAWYNGCRHCLRVSEFMKVIDGEAIKSTLLCICSVHCAKCTVLWCIAKRL